ASNATQAATRPDGPPGPPPADDSGDSGAHAGNPGGMPIEQLVAELPPAVAGLGAGARWNVVAVAPIGVTVWRLERPGEPAVFLKVAPDAGGGAARLRAEAD